MQEMLPLVPFSKNMYMSGSGKSCSSTYVISTIASHIKAGAFKK